MERTENIHVLQRQFPEAQVRQEGIGGLTSTKVQIPKQYNPLEVNLFIQRNRLFTLFSVEQQM